MASPINRKLLFEDLGYEPHPGQLLVHQSKAPRRVVACGARWGKTLCAAMEGIAAALEPKERSMGWVVAPTYDLADKVYREITYIAARHLRHRIKSLKENERRLVLKNMGGGLSEIRAKSADNPVSLLGEGLEWLIVDEAARMKPSIWEGHLSQRLLDKRGWALLISTPRGKGWFYELFMRGQRGEPDHASWNYPSSSNPHLDASLIEAERGRLPERVFGEQYGGEFLEGAGAVFRFVREAAVGDWQEPQPKTTYFAGLDLAKVEDFSVLVILNGKGEVVAADRFHRLDWSVQIQRIGVLVERYRCQEVHVDSTGAGEPIYESLRAAGCPAKAHAFTQASKAALINNLALLLEKRSLVLPKADVWPELIDELEAFEFSVTDAGTVKTGAPYGVHDDTVIALALAAWRLRPSAVRPRLIGAPPRVFCGDPF